MELLRHIRRLWKASLHIVGVVVQPWPWTLRFISGYYKSDVSIVNRISVIFVNSDLNFAEIEIMENLRHYFIDEN